MLISVIDDMNFGQKLRKLREEKGIKQQELADKLGYVTNSYVSDVEKGLFVPSEAKLKKIAKILKVPSSQIKGLLIESKIEELGVKEPELQELFKDVPKLPASDKRKIIEVYVTIKKKLKHKN